MAFTLRSSNTVGTGSGTTAAVQLTSIAAGDVVVVWAANGASVDINSVSDGTTSLTLLNQLSNGSLRTRIAYLLASVATGSVTYTITFASSVGANVCAAAFVPPSAASFDVDLATGVGGSGTAISSGNITTTGSDELVVGCASNENTAGYTAHLVNSVAADGNVIKNGASLWWRFVSATFTGAATVTIDVSSRWSCHVVAIKAAPDTHKYLLVGN